MYCLLQTSPTSDPFPKEPAQYNQNAIDQYYGPRVYRRQPTGRPPRVEIPVHQNARGRARNTIPDDADPNRPLRKIEAKEGAVTEELIAVEEEADQMNRATQTEPIRRAVVPYKAPWQQGRMVPVGHVSSFYNFIYMYIVKLF